MDDWSQTSSEVLARLALAGKANIYFIDHLNISWEGPLPTLSPRSYRADYSAVERIYIR
jgi:hypothetical protein